MRFYPGNQVTVVIESLFVVTVARHAMLGVRSIPPDLGLGDTGHRRVSVGVAVLCLVALCQGFWMIAMLAATG